MPDDDILTMASHAELVSALAYGLRFDERGKAHQQASELAARIAAETLARYLAQAGFVVMKRPPGKLHGTPRGD
jgi:hypothetical protein